MDPNISPTNKLTESQPARGAVDNECPTDRCVFPPHSLASAGQRSKSVVTFSSPKRATDSITISTTLLNTHEVKPAGPEKNTTLIKAGSKKASSLTRTTTHAQDSDLWTESHAVKSGACVEFRLFVKFYFLSHCTAFSFSFWWGQFGGQVTASRLIAYIAFMILASMHVDCSTSLSVTDERTLDCSTDRGIAQVFVKTCTLYCGGFFDRWITQVFVKTCTLYCGGFFVRWITQVFVKKCTLYCVVFLDRWITQVFVKKRALKRCSTGKRSSLFVRYRTVFVPGEQGRCQSVSGEIDMRQ